MDRSIYLLPRWRVTLNYCSGTPLAIEAHGKNAEEAAYHALPYAPKERGLPVAWHATSLDKLDK